MVTLGRRCVYLIILLAHFHVLSQTFPTGFSRQTVSASFSQPTVLTFAPDGRMFAAQQTGQLRIVKNDVLLPTPFVTITVDPAGERGLIGVALDPNFALNNFVYVYYTVPGTPPHNRISRFTANGDVAVAGSEVVVLELDPLSSATNHNGGALAFGGDGKLYVGVGENALPANAQNPNTYHGKILRINSDGSIPAGNPFPAGSDHAKRVWALGLRNPYVISVNGTNGKIFAIDVGANSWEEINDISVGGKNFGWPAAEGNTADPQYTNPVFTYPHGTGTSAGCALTGGAFFNPSATNYPASYYGNYFFVDYCERWMSFIDPTDLPVTSSLFGSTISGLPVYVAVGLDGNLYFLSRSGAIYRIVYGNDSPPFITQHPEDIDGAEGLGASFEVKAIGTLPIQYQWKKDNQEIAGATESTYSIVALSADDAGLYTVVLTNIAGSVESNVADLTVVPVTGIRESPRDRVLSIFPNPVGGTEAVIQFHADTDGTGFVRVVSMHAKEIVNVRAEVSKGLNEIKLPVSELPNGMYVVSVESNNRTSFLKLAVCK